MSVPSAIPQMSTHAIPQIAKGVKPEYHHFIPRFILRRYQLQPVVKRPPGKTGKGKKGRQPPYDPNSETVYVYDIATHKLDALPLGKVYGAQNLYQDVSAKDVMELEKSLSRLENHGAAVIAELHKSSSGNFTLKRKGVNHIMKFLFVMHYRQQKLSHSYFQEDHPENRPLVEWMTHFRAKHNLTTPTELWLHTLRYYIDTPHQQICDDAAAVYRKYTPFKVAAMMLGGNIDPLMEEGYHAIAYAALDNEAVLGFWEAAEGTEFILSQNSFGLWEGLLGGAPGLHRIYVVSPRFAIVLRQRIMVEGSPHNPFMNTDFLDIKLSLPVVSSTNAPSNTTPGKSRAFGDDDMFTFTITKLTEKQMQTFNSVILSNVRPDGSITFLTKGYALQTIRTHLVSFLNFLDRPKYEPLIQELSGSVTPPPPTWKTSVHRADILSDSVSDVELYTLLLDISTGVKTFSSSTDRAQAVFQLVKTSRNSRSSFAADYRLSLESAIQLFLGRSRFSRERQPRVKLLVSISADLSYRLFTAFTPFMKSLGVKLASSDLLDQLLHEVIIWGFLGWITHDEEVFNLVKNSSPALTTALSELAGTGSNQGPDSHAPHIIKSSSSPLPSPASPPKQHPTPNSRPSPIDALRLGVERMTENPSQLRSRYDRAYLIWSLFAAVPESDIAVNGFCAEVQRISSETIRRFNLFLRPPPPGFVPNTRAELVPSMSEKESLQLFAISKEIMGKMGIAWPDQSDRAGMIATDTSLLIFLLWLLRNRDYFLTMLLPGISLLKK